MKAAKKEKQKVGRFSISLSFSLLVPEQCYNMRKGVFCHVGMGLTDCNALFFFFPVMIKIKLQTPFLKAPPILHPPSGAPHCSKSHKGETSPAWHFVIWKKLRVSNIVWQVGLTEKWHNQRPLVGKVGLPSRIATTTIAHTTYRGVCLYCTTAQL